MCYHVCGSVFRWQTMNVTWRDFIKHSLCLPALWLTVAMARGSDSNAADQEHLTPHDCPPFISLSLSLSASISLFFPSYFHRRCHVFSFSIPRFWLSWTHQPLILPIDFLITPLPFSTPLFSLPSACLSVGGPAARQMWPALSQLLASWSWRREEWRWKRSHITNEA